MGEFHLLGGKRQPEGPHPSFTDRGYATCNGNEPEVQCKMIAKDCRLANRACMVLDALGKDNATFPNYNTASPYDQCWGFVGAVLCQACYQVILDFQKNSERFTSSEISYWYNYCYQTLGCERSYRPYPWLSNKL